VHVDGAVPSARSCARGAVEGRKTDTRVAYQPRNEDFVLEVVGAVARWGCVHTYIQWAM